MKKFFTVATLFWACTFTQQAQISPSKAVAMAKDVIYLSVSETELGSKSGRQDESFSEQKIPFPTVDISDKNKIQFHTFM